MNVQLKALLIAVAVFTVFDAAVWGGRYRTKAVNKAVYTTHWVLEQDWGPRLSGGRCRERHHPVWAVAC